MWLFKKRIPAEHLATILFNKLVLEDEEVVLNKILDKKSGININTLSEQMFVYLVSLIAVALTTEAETQPAIIYIKYPTIKCGIFYMCCRGRNRTFIPGFKVPCPAVRRPGNFSILLDCSKIFTFFK